MFECCTRDKCCFSGHQHTWVSTVKPGSSAEKDGPEQRPKEARQRLTVKTISANQWIHFLIATLLSFYSSFNAALRFQ